MVQTLKRNLLLFLKMIIIMKSTGFLESTWRRCSFILCASLWLAYSFECLEFCQFKYYCGSITAKDYFQLLFTDLR